jgi:diguanylate cyclase (GGDEF)-like protein
LNGSVQAAEEIAAAAAADLERLVEHVHAELAVRVPEYHRALLAAGEDPVAVCAGTLQLFLGSIRSRELTALAAPSIRRVGRARSQAAVPLDVILEAIGLERDLAARELERRARTAGHGEDVILILERALERAADAISSALARGYMDAIRDRGREERQALAAVVEIAAAVNRSLDLVEVAQAGLAAVLSAIGADAAAIWSLRAGGDELVLSYTSGLRWDEDSALRAAPAETLPLVIRARQAGTAVDGGPLAIVNRRILASAIGIGLRSRGELVGVLVAGTRGPRQFHRQELSLVVAAADHLASALVRAEKHRREAGTDSLTGLANRQEFERQVGRLVAGAQRHHRPLALALIDLDGLKEINDGWGHAAGDRALQRVAQTLLNAVRETDVCGRIGGDEFALAMPESTVEQATEVVRRIQAAVERIRAPEFDAPLRLSVGVAGWKPAMVWPELFRLADQRLYREKRRHHRERSRG